MDSNLSIEEFSRQILGEEENGIITFLASIFQWCCGMEEQQEQENVPYYVAFITRRCHILLEIYWENKRKDIFKQVFDLRGKPSSDSECRRYEDIYTKHFVTDTAVSTMCADFTAYYMEHKKFPHLLVADELLYHGRALNNFLYTTYQNIVQRCELTKGWDHDIGTLERAFLDALTIKTRASNTRHVLLLSKYNSRLSSQPYSTPSWRRLSLSYAQLVSVSSVNNVAYSWSFRVPQNKAIQVPKDRMDIGIFHKVSTYVQGIHQDSFVSLYPNPHHPKMACVIRTKKSISAETEGIDSLTNRQLYVPFCIFDHLSLNGIWQLHQKIVYDIQQEQGDCAVYQFLSCYDKEINENQYSNTLRIYYRRISETNDLILNFLYMKKFLRDVLGLISKEDQKTYIDCIDFEQLSRNYATFHLYPKAIEKMLKEIWNWDAEESKLEEYLEFLLRDVPQLETEFVVPEQRGCVLKRDDPIVYCVEDAIAEIGYEGEQNVYQRTSNGVILSDAALSRVGYCHSLDTLLSKCKKKLVTYLGDQAEQVTLYQVLGVITQAMDLGLLGMNTVFERHPCENNELYEKEKPEVYTRQRAGEASMFIYPIRYNQFLKALNRIMDYRRDNFSAAQFDISRLIRYLDKKSIIKLDNSGESIQTMEQRLLWFYEKLWFCGQKLEDWDFDLSDRRKKIKNDQCNLSKVIEDIYNDM